jgi:hypothetical protein
MVSEKLVSNTIEMRNGQQIFSSYHFNFLPLTCDPVNYLSLFLVIMTDDLQRTMNVPSTLNIKI